ncbi:MAG: GTP-binding protein, partial [Alphaproteobacteria bacterium]|nr:GTP-binding protein [Alphaproteobacteria bacterium]
MGHVDTGKTTLMDKIRNTNIQQKETAGITQQIDATFIPKSKLPINSIAVPGLLMIDTPGHEAFSNLRIRGSSLADIIIVVIDLVHGLEKQTIEILDILNKTQTKYIIALNKIDRLYGWDNNKLLHDALPECMDEFNNRLSTIKYQLQEQGINSELYWNNTSLQDTVSVCPISARTEQGIIELLTQIAVISETELCDKITISDELKCVVLEKRVLPGYGTIVDALLINGTLTRGDNILIQTNSGTINSKICNLITEHENTTIHGSVAFKLIASGL